MVVDQDEETLADLQFGALADRTRRDILRRAQEGRLSVSALAREYPISLAAVQKHVAVLERAELVTKHRIGRESIVRVEADALDRARAALDRLASDWHGRIERIDNILDEPTGES
jgi:DNA-binding transcriptional ArsR family regulator